MWVQTDAPCEVEVRPEGVAPARERTFTVEGHHYALVHVTGLPADAAIAVRGRARRRGRVARARQRVPAERPAHPHAARRRCGSSSAPAASPRRTSRRTRCARTSTRTGARSTRCAAWRWSMAHQPPDEWPHALLLLGDQVYADEVHPARRGAARRRGRSPTTTTTSSSTVASWGEPVIRWLLSTVPERDDLRRPRRPRRLEHVDRVGRRRCARRTGGAGGSSPRSRATSSTSTSGTCRRPSAAEFELYEQLRTAPDPTPRLRAFAKQADEEVEGHALELLPRHRAGARGDDRLARRARARPRQPLDGRPARSGSGSPSTPRGDVDHLLIGTSLPLIMGPAMHWLEAWNEPVADGAWGKLAKKVAEKLRQELDLEHWPAFQDVVPAHVRAPARGRRRPPRRGAVDDLRALRRRPPRVPGRGRLPARRRRAVGGLAGGLLAVPQPARRQGAAGDPRRLDAPGGRVHARARAPRRRAAIPTSAGGSRTTSRGSTIRSPGWNWRAGTPSSSCKRRCRRRTERASRVWRRVFERSIEPNAVFATGLRHNPGARVMIR